MDDSHRFNADSSWDDTQTALPHTPPNLDASTMGVLFNAVPDGWYLVDARGLIAAANPALAEMFATTVDQLPHKPISTWIAAQDVPRLAGTFRDVYHSRKPVAKLHVWTKGSTPTTDAGTTTKAASKAAGKSGLPDAPDTRRCLEFSITPVMDADNRVNGFSGLVRDVTYVVTRLEEYESLEKVRAQFVRIITHDLRNPLTLAIGYLDFLAETLQPDRYTEQGLYLEQIRRAHQRIQELTSDGLTLEQTYATQRPPENRVLLDLLTRKAMIDFRAQALNSSKQLSFPFDPELGDVVVLGEESILYRAIANLVSNALKYTPAGGRIILNLSINTDEPEARAVFSVVDTGFGIPEADQAHLFTAFHRVQTPETQSIEGAGLGLYIVKRIIEWHGGSVFFHSVYGKGSTFGFELPCVSGNAKIARV
ncbi:MAG: ATP-binding protein [Anaerolineae bacterium]